MAPSPLAILRKPRFLLTFFLLIWTSRWFCVHFCCCLKSCCSGGNTDVRTGWSEEQQSNVCLRLWLTLMDRVSSNTLTPFSHEALPHFSSSESPQNSWQGLFCVFTFVFLQKLIPDLFHFRFGPWGLCWHVWAKGAQPILSKFFFSRYRVCVSDSHLQCELYFKWLSSLALLWTLWW